MARKILFGTLVLLLILISIGLVLVILNYTPLSIAKDRDYERLEHANAVVVNIWIDNMSRLDVLRENEVKYLIVDVGGTKQNGRLVESLQIGRFVALIEDYEAKNNYSFILLPYSETNSYKYDILSPEFQENYIREYKNLIARGFDGIHVDIEPVRLDQREEYLDLLERLGEELPKDAIISVYSGGIDGNKNNEWSWETNYFYYVSKRVDLIALPGYDTGIKDKEVYEEHLRYQIKQIESRNWDADFLFSIPTHREYPETAEISIDVFKEEVKDNPSSSFIGVAVFAEWTAKEIDWKSMDRIDKLFGRIFL